MRRDLSVALAPPFIALFSVLFSGTSSTSVLAQQTGVAHPMLLAELTYGESINAVARNADGTLWVGGFTCSASLPTTPGAIQRSWSGPPCLPVGFLARMKTDGALVYLSYFGGSATSTVSALTTDANGYLYVGGWTESVDFPTTPGGYDRICACDHKDAFVTKIAPDGTAIVFSTYLGGTDDDWISSIAVDANGRVHVAGSTSSGDFPVTSRALQPALAGGGADGFYARLSADGASLQYATYLGGSKPDGANGVAVDSAGDAYVAGTTASTDFPMFNPASTQPPENAQVEAFLARFSSSGPVYSTYFGGSGTSAGAVSVVGDRVYLAGSENWVNFPAYPGGADSATSGNAYVSELSAANGGAARSIALHGTTATGAAAAGLAVDQNHVAYMVGSFRGNDCTSCGPESGRYPTTWDAYKHQLSGGDRDAVLSIVDFRPDTPVVLYSTMLGGRMADSGFAITSDGSGGAFIAGKSDTEGGFDSINAQPQPQPDPGANDQSFVAHVGDAQVAMPDPPADIVLYASDQNGLTPTTIAGDWKIDADATAAGGWTVHELDQASGKVAVPAVRPQNYFETTVLAGANVPYHLWLRMKADADSWQNDSVWVQFSDSVDAGGNPIWRIHSNDSTSVSLEDCGGCGEQGWGWNDNGYGVAGTPVMFATSGWHTIRIQQREDGISIDQIVLSSSKWLNTAPGANRNDTTLLAQSFALPSGNQPPTISITSPSNGATFAGPVNVTLTASAGDNDGTVSQVAFYRNGQFLNTVTSPPYSMTVGNLSAGTYTFTAIATDNQGATMTSAAVTITVTGTKAEVPPGWTDADVGATGAAGSAACSNGTFTVRGAGADVWGTSDAFNYVYLPLSGDGTVVARVTMISTKANWVKAGVMIRGSLDPSSPQAFMLVSHAKGVAFQRRTAGGNTSVSTAGSASTAPRWVKLVRSGNLISGYESADGRTWTLVGSDTFSMAGSALVGLALSSHVSGTVATAEFESVSTPLPSGWADSDIGSVPFVGATAYGAGTISVTGSGADVWDAADAFHYAYRSLSGDGTIVARVATVQNVNAWVKAGVMIRATLNPDSAHAFVLVSAAKGVAFQRRGAAGGTSINTAGSASTAPRWIKLTRSGNTFTAFESDDGTNWSEIATDTIPMGTAVYVGVAVTSHTTSSSATCAFDNVSIH